MECELCGRDCPPDDVRNAYFSTPLPFDIYARWLRNTQEDVIEKTIVHVAIGTYYIIIACMDCEVKYSDYCI